MQDDPFTRYARGYATGLPVIGLGGLPDPYSMIGVLDREEKERQAQQRVISAFAKREHRAYPRVSRQRRDDLDYSR